MRGKMVWLGLLIAPTGGLGILGGCGDGRSPFEIPTSTLVIETYPAVLPIPWTLRDFKGEPIAGIGNTVLRNQRPGTYTLEWDDLPGWATPLENPRTRFVAGGETVYFTGVYVPLAETGNLVVDVDPDALNAPWRLLLPDNHVLLGSGQQSFLGASTGHYQITWEAIEGWETPDPPIQQLTLEPGETIVFAGDYDPSEGGSAGAIRITVEPTSLDAPWSLILPGGATAAGTGAAYLPDLPPGAYTIAWGAVAGWLAPVPNPFTDALAAGEELEFTGEFTWVPPTGTIIINPDPDTIHAPWSLAGPAGYQLAGAGDRTLGGLLLGSYTLTWGEVIFYYTPVENPVLGILDEVDPLIFATQYLPTGDGDRLGIYADPLGLTTQVTIVPYELTELYILAHVPSIEGTKITAAEFSVPNWLDPGPYGAAELTWNTLYVLGNIQDGVALAFPETGQIDEHHNVLIATARIYSTDATWPAADTRLITRAWPGHGSPVVVNEAGEGIAVAGDTLIVNPSNLRR